MKKNCKQCKKEFEAKEIQLSKNLKKEVETGKNGTQKYVLKQGVNKGKTI